MSDLLSECVRRQAERERCDWGDAVDDPIERRRIGSYVGPIIADVLDILAAEGRVFLPPQMVAVGIDPPAHEPRWHTHAAPTTPDEGTDPMTSHEEG